MEYACYAAHEGFKDTSKILPRPRLPAILLTPVTHNTIGKKIQWNADDADEYDARR